eukprot:m.47348 g.47348  ORF g.47348 m.47348 type:complete len:383 (+) comp20472_c1_seq1:440-1588(+)
MDRRVRRASSLVLLCNIVLFFHKGHADAATELSNDTLSSEELDKDYSICITTTTIKELQNNGALTCSNLAPFCNDLLHGDYIRNACPHACALCASMPTTSQPSESNANAANGDSDSEDSISQSGAIAVMSVGVLLFGVMGYATYSVLSARCGGSDLLYHQNTPPPPSESFEGEWDDEMWTNEDEANLALGAAKENPIQSQVKQASEITGFSSAIRPNQNNRGQGKKHHAPDVPPRPSREKSTMAPLEDAHEPRFQQTRHGQVLRLGGLTDNETSDVDNANIRTDHMPTALPQAPQLSDAPHDLGSRLQNQLGGEFEPNPIFFGRMIYDWSSDRVIPAQEWERRQQIICIELEGDYNNIVGDPCERGLHVRTLSYNPLDSMEL